MISTRRNPKISIITVCFNEENDIDNTCKSVAFQDFDDYEWIVIDGGSSDKTVEILKKYEKNITILISEKDRGVYDAMNKGIRIAKGEYILFLNGGDSLFRGDVLREVFDKKMHSAGILYGNCCVINMDNTQQLLDFPDKINKEYFFSSNINHQSTFIRKDLFEKYGYYDDKYKVLADYEKWLCFINKKVIFKKIAIIVSNFKGFDGLSSNERTRSLIEKERKNILKKYYKFYEIFLFEFKKILQNKNKQLIFIVFSPGKFIKKYINILLNSKLRKPARKIWHAIRLKKIS